jgi:hypothetical protein
MKWLTWAPPLLVAVLALGAVSGCAPGSSTSAITPVAVAVSDARDKNLTKDVVALSAEPVAYDGYSMEIIGATFDESTGDVMKDLTIGTGLKRENFDDSTARGFAFGFKNSSNKETAKKDAYVAVYVKYELLGESSQRDSVVPQSEFSAIDDQGERADFLYVSNKDEYIDTKYPYGVLIFKTYSDAKTLELDLNGRPYVIDLALLNES